jgi:hypothetical protein
MRTIKSTGNPEEDARLVAEALGQSNAESFDKARERAALSNSGKEAGNALVSTPHLEGETLLVLPDENEKAVQEDARRDEAKGSDTRQPEQALIKEQE